MDSGTIRARAHAPLNAGIPNHGVTIGTSPGRARRSANQQGGGALGNVGPGEVSAMDGSDIPLEYREQVRRYYRTR